ncbi:AraC family transcriptional regulator [Clostridium sp. Marseille-P2415]|uniref:AraC family transcriptional regulator n=1 Tax=Clostridium sp. Marseille-P2415 TaxID=1805471 RepID=UPI00098894FD|nr:AraC family transcriptional regulator [Clostridium sp. Marseille-P2415]
MYNQLYNYEISRDSQAEPSSWYSLNNNCAPHFHSALELVYVRSGIMEATLNGKFHCIQGRELLLVPSYTVHRYLTPERSDTIVMIIPLSYIPAFQKILRRKTFSLCRISDKSITREVARCMRYCCGLQHKKPDSMAARGYIHVILALLTENIPLENLLAKDDDALVRNILTYLNNNYKNPLSLKSVADEFGYSTSRFSHIFNKHVGCSISEYVNALRCRQVAGMLLDGEESVTQAAMGAGFNSMRTFYRSFMHVFGISPSKYVDVSKDNDALRHSRSGVPVYSGCKGLCHVIKGPLDSIAPIEKDRH